MQRILKMSLHIMPLRWVPSAWCRTITFPRVGRVTPLIPLHALLSVTTLVEMFWKSYV